MMEDVADKIKFSFDHSANTYDSYADIQYKVADKVCSFILSNSSNNTVKNNILDIGCGTGNIGNLLKLKCDNFLQADLSYKMCKIANLKNNNLSINCNIDLLPFKSNFFDLIISSMAIHWTEKLDFSFNNLISILNNNGELYISLPILGTFKELSELLIYRGCPIGNFYTLRELTNIINKLNVRKTKIICCQYTEYYKSFRHFLITLILTGSYVRKFLINKKINIFEVSKMYNNLYSIGNLIYVSWNIAYVIIIK